MKKNIHPKYQKVLFIDSSTGHKFLCGAALQTEETETYEGVEYPVYRVAVSSASHPFFTGSKQFVDSEGRVDKFKKRYRTVQRKSTEEESKKEEEKPEATEQGTAKKGKTKSKKKA